MTINEKYGFDKPEFAALREPSRAVIAAYQTANRFMDTTQEYTLIELGMPYLAEALHRMAHEFPKRFDAFGEMLHERHLMAEYPATEELDWQEELHDVDDVFEMCIRILENIGEALENFRTVTDNGVFRAMSLFAENLISENSRDYTKILAAWKRWDEDGGSRTSFDAWCKHFFEEGGAI